MMSRDRMISGDRLNRRRFLATSVAAIAAPGAAGAQQRGQVHRIAIIHAVIPIAEMTSTGVLVFRTFFEELRRLGYAEGKNLVVERRSADGDARRLPELARELVGLKPAAIFTNEDLAAQALKVATTTIPIVAVVGDPVVSGYAASLARPGSNVTGFSIAIPGLVAKRIALLKEAVPAASRMAVLMARRVWETVRVQTQYREAVEAAGIVFIAAVLDPAADEAAYRRAFAAMVRDRTDALLVVGTREHLAHRQLIAGLAIEARLPSMNPYRESATAGGLMAYAPDDVALFRGAAGYVDRILRGANPAEMPFQQPTKFELIINLKTAKALGITIPAAVLVRADEVIE